MFLEKHKRFADELRGLLKEAIADDLESIEMDKRAKTDYSNEFNASLQKKTAKAVAINKRLDELVLSYVEPNFLERLFGVKPGLSEWTRWRNMAKQDIGRLPAEQRGPAWIEFKELEGDFEEIKGLALKMFETSKKAKESADESVRAADEDIKKADRDIAEMKAELARRQKMKGQPPAK